MSEKSRRDKAKPATRMASSISVCACEHGHLFVRLHDEAGEIFAAASVDRCTAMMLVDQVVTELDIPSARCGSTH